jgi:hypothetical protein
VSRPFSPSVVRSFPSHDQPDRGAAPRGHR